MNESELRSASPPAREAALVARALEQPAAARAAFLQAVCGEDKALRARLEALLAAHELPATELASPETSTAEAAAGIHDLDEAVGQTLGRYKLLERIGEGGWPRRGKATPAS